MKKENLMTNVENLYLKDPDNFFLIEIGDLVALSGEW